MRSQLVSPLQEALSGLEPLPTFVSGEAAASSKTTAGDLSGFKDHVFHRQSARFAHVEAGRASTERIGKYSPL